MAILTSGQSQIKTSHWYDANGQPRHTMPKANGDGERTTTIRDAKAQHLFPSVTNIIGILDRPALTKWKIGKVLDAALLNPKADGETVDYWKTRVQDAAYQETADAADLGSKIHAAMDGVWEGRPVPPEFLPYLQPVVDWMMQTKIIVTKREHRVVNQTEGFAGTTDVLFTWDNGAGMGILDYKTKKTKPGESVDSYLEHRMQLAAYAATFYGPENLDRVLAANIFISSTEVGRMEVIKCPDLPKYWEAFKACATIWRVSKGYDPRGAK